MLTSPTGPHVAMSATVHVALLFVAAASPRPRITRLEQIEAIRPYMIALEAKSRAEEHVVADLEGDDVGRAVNDSDGDGVAGGGERHAEVEGSLGAALSRGVEPRRWSQRKRPPEARGKWDGKSPSAAEFGLVGLLGHRGSMAVFGPGDRAAPSDDPVASNGAMWSHVVGESPGAEGLGLSGTGIGGGGTGAGIGVDHVGDLGHTKGPPGPGTGGKGSLDLWGGSIGGWSDGGWALDGFGIRSADGARAPSSCEWNGTVYRCGGGVEVSGRIPPEAIQRIVRQNFGRFRLCYERGLVKNPALTGRVATRFVIGGAGNVSESSNHGSDLPDADVVACVTRAFTTLAFPKPQDSTVTVVYPIRFLPE
jgi:hypothetical protein